MERAWKVRKKIWDQLDEDGNVGLKAHVDYENSSARYFGVRRQKKYRCSLFERAWVGVNPSSCPSW
jgi:hypothetical protein